MENNKTVRDGIATQCADKMEYCTSCMMTMSMKSSMFCRAFLDNSEMINLVGKDHLRRNRTSDRSSTQQSGKDRPEWSEERNTEEGICYSCH